MANGARQPLARPSLGRVAGTNDSLAIKARWLGAKRQSAGRSVGRRLGYENVIHRWAAWKIPHGLHDDRLRRHG